MVQEGQNREMIRTRMNRANNRSRLGKKSEAIADYERVILEIENSPEKAELDDLRAQIHIILGEEYAKSGDIELSLKNLQVGQDYFERLSLDRVITANKHSDLLYYHSKASEILQIAEKPDEAIDHLNKAIKLLHSEITHGSVPAAWESMLGNWSQLSERLVEIQLTHGKDPLVALIEAESCKGRLITWIKRAYIKGSDNFALDKQRHLISLEQCAGWCEQSSKRYIISFYGADNGLALFAIYGKNKCKAVWITDAPYQDLLNDYFSPWEALFEGSEENPQLLTWIGGATELLLDRIGEWLTRLLPEITDGGNELVLIPHRLFRSLPLSHVRLPGGKLLSELFTSVYCLPSIFDFAQALNTAGKPKPLLSDVKGFVDPDGTLPFARFEGNLILDAERLREGKDVMVENVTKAFSNSSMLLLSCHGDFDENNPWNSQLDLSDGRLGLEPLFMIGKSRPSLNLLVLGACEAAKHRHSMSDEPVGFASMMVLLGISDAVLAPMWKVDDFATALFLTDFFRQLNEGVYPATAVQKAAFYVRDLTARETIVILQDWADRLSGNKYISEIAFNQLEVFQGWLSQLKWNERPFRSPRDWAAFQLIGLPIASIGDSTKT